MFPICFSNYNANELGNFSCHTENPYKIDISRYVLGIHNKFVVSACLNIWPLGTRIGRPVLKI